MKNKSKWNCAFCLTSVSKGHWERQNGKCQRCHFYFPEAMPFQNVCLEFGCTEMAKMGDSYCMEHTVDKRYNTPKLVQPLATDTAALMAVKENPYYREVNNLLKDDESKETQMTQIKYGLDKYPETLNGDNWSVIEALEHIQSELVDGLHYISLLKAKIKEMEKEKVKP